eukprot:10250667-Alexandrium_andersonii.AAC.1
MCIRDSLVGWPPESPPGPFGPLRWGRLRLGGEAGEGANCTFKGVGAPAAYLVQLRITVFL